MLSFLSAGTYRCAVKTSILRSLGLHFGTLGDHFGIILESLGLLWGPLGAFGRQGRFWWIFPSKVSSILEPFWHPKSQMSHKITKQTVSRKRCRKNVLPEVARNGPMCDPYCKYHRFREVKECPFGWLWGSFWLPFGVILGHFLQKVAIRGPTKTHQKNIPNEKREREESDKRVVNP